MGSVEIELQLASHYIDKWKEGLNYNLVIIYFLWLQADNCNTISGLKPMTQNKIIYIFCLAYLMGIAQVCIHSMYIVS